MGFYVTGAAAGTGPGQTLWLCHRCDWSGVLPVGAWHLCAKPKP